LSVENSPDVLMRDGELTLAELPYWATLSPDSNKVFGSVSANKNTTFTQYKHHDSDTSTASARIKARKTFTCTLGIQLTLVEFWAGAWFTMQQN
jgi:hypothetical protein